MPLPLLYIGIAAGSGLAGFVAGALSRQPEINELKKQVKSLQKEVERLQAVISVQNQQINELKIRYTALKGWQFVERNKQRGYIKGSLVYEYALKEYIGMLIEADTDNQVNLNKSEVQFYNAFGKILNKGEINTSNRSAVIEYIKGKYGREINSFIEPNMDSIVDYLE